MILCYAKPDEVRFENLSDWITVIEDEVKMKLRAMEVFIRVRTMRILTGHNTGVQKTGGFVLHDTEAMTNTDTGLNIDTVERHETLTPRAGDMGKQQFTLCPEDTSRLPHPWDSLIHTSHLLVTQPGPEP